jgi:hypothetical protein
LELPGKALALDAEVGDEAMGVDDIEGNFLIERDGSGGAGVHFCLEERNAVEAPGSVDELLNEVRFGGGGGLVFVEETAMVVSIGGRVLSGEYGEAAVRPWRRALSEERCLPAGVRGPVECIAFARLRDMGGWGLGIGVAIGFVVIGLVMNGLAIGIACARGMDGEF